MIQKEVKSFPIFFLSLLVQHNNNKNKKVKKKNEKGKGREGKKMLRISEKAME